MVGREFEIKNNTVYMGRKKLGVISWREKTFRTYRRFSVHFFKMYEGWGLNRRLLFFLRKKGIRWVEVWDNDTGDIYKTEVERFLRYGIRYWNPKYEKDVQLVLPVIHWDMVETDREKKRNFISSIT